MKKGNAVLKVGTEVTCLEVQGDWMHIDSCAWICCYDDGEYLVN